jgi:hypothetical protein
MPRLAADPVIVSAEQREALERLERTHSTPQQLALRARMILQAADGVGVRASARDLGVWRKTVRYWQNDVGRLRRDNRLPSGLPMRPARELRPFSRRSKSAPLFR